MKKQLFTLLLPLIVFSVTACGGETGTVESGTYIGTVDNVVPEETEIYVQTNDGQRLELYFTDTTELTRNGETVAFGSLEEGQSVEVEVEKVGQRLDPISVTILE
ncbi:MAG: hypothetical protein WD625_07840 [Balneolales bacterium]